MTLNLDSKSMNRRQTEDLALLAELEAQEDAFFAEANGKPLPKAENVDAEQDLQTGVDIEEDVKPPVAKEEPPKEEKTVKPKRPSLQEDPAAYWKHEAEVAARRKADADRTLTPVQQENAELRRRLQELENRTRSNDEIASLRQQLDDIKKSLQTSPTSVQAQSVIAEDEALEQERQILRSQLPEAARLTDLETERLRRSQQERDKEMQAQIAKLQEAKRDLDNAKEESVYKERVSNHRAVVLDKHPDIDEIYKHASDQLMEWAGNESQTYLDAVTHPINFDARFFSKVIADFKKHIGAIPDEVPAPRKPSGGDLAVKIRTAAPPAAEGKEDMEFLTDEQMSDFEGLMQRQRSNPDEQARLLERFERTIQAMQMPTT